MKLLFSFRSDVCLAEMLSPCKLVVSALGFSFMQNADNVETTVTNSMASE